MEQRKDTLPDYHWIFVGLSMTLTIIAVNSTETQMNLPQNRILVNKCRLDIWQQVIRKSCSDCGKKDTASCIISFYYAFFLFYRILFHIFLVHYDKNKVLKMLIVNANKDCRRISCGHSVCSTQVAIISAHRFHLENYK